MSTILNNPNIKRKPPAVISTLNPCWQSYLLCLFYAFNFFQQVEKVPTG